MLAAVLTLGIALCVAGLAGLHFLRRPDDAAPAAFILAFTTFPAVVPEVIAVGPIGVRPYEPVLILALAIALLRNKASVAANRLSFISLALVVFGTLHGLYEGNTTKGLIADLRVFPLFTVAFVVAARAWGTPVIERCLRALPLMLWFSLGLTLLNSATGFPVHGRSESTALGTVEAVDGATRVITPITYLAIFVVCACAALAIGGKARGWSAARATLNLWGPSLVIVFLAFSRNNLLSIFASLLFAVLAARSARSLVYATYAVAFAGIAALVIFAAGPILNGLPGGAYLNEQVAGYVGRVVEGLNEQSRATDSSLLYRDSEDNWASRAISEAPVVGHGFGYAYKPQMSGVGFFANGAQYYVHDFYRWIAIKAGTLGLVAFLVIALSPVIAALRRRTAPAAALGAGATGLLAASFVAPMPNGTPTAVLLGGALGALAAAAWPNELVPCTRTGRRARSRTSPATS